MVISFANQKGGVGKTTTALNLSSILSFKGFKVLAVDMDPQGNLTSGLGFDKSKQDYNSTYELISDDAEVSKVFVVSDINDNLHFIPSKIDLSGAEVELISRFSREKVLSSKLAKVRRMYDYILIDCPPSLGLLTINSLVAADSIIIPVQCEYYALEGISQLINILDIIRKNLNEKLEILGVVMTMFDSRTKLSLEVVEEVRKFFGEKVFDTVIPRNVKLSESPSFGKPINLYDPHSSGAKAYESLANEIILRTQNDSKWHKPQSR